MAHGDFRIEVKFSVPASNDERERSRIVAACDTFIEGLRERLAEVASNAVEVGVKSVRENAARRGKGRPALALPRDAAE